MAEQHIGAEAVGHMGGSPSARVGRGKGLKAALHEVPRWGWVAAGLAVVVLVIWKLRSSSSSSSSAGQTTAAGVANSPGATAPTVFDPTTGATMDYGTALSNLLYSEQMSSAQYSGMQDLMKQEADALAALQGSVAGLQLAGTISPNPTPAPPPAFLGPPEPAPTSPDPLPSPSPAAAPSPVIDWSSFNWSDLNPFTPSSGAGQPAPVAAPPPAQLPDPASYWFGPPPPQPPPAPTAPVYIPSPYQDAVAAGASPPPPILTGGLFIPTYPLAPTAPAPNATGSNKIQPLMV